jgi:hypothetical protein
MTHQVKFMCEGAYEVVLNMEDFEERPDHVQTTKAAWESILQQNDPSDHDRFHETAMLISAEESTQTAAWMEADEKEVHSLVIENNCWRTEELPEGARPITSKWVRRKKPSGKLKSQVCGRGFNMIHGTDFHETFAPVAKMTTFRIFLSYVAILDLHTGSLDIKTAYLNAPIQEAVWMKPPPGLLQQLRRLRKKETSSKLKSRLTAQIAGLERGHYLRLLKAIYGTKQAGREWFMMLNTFLTELGFVPNAGDTCFYTLLIDSNYVILLLYVDDIIIAANTPALKMKYVKIIRKRFKTSYSGELEEYLNIAIVHDRSNRTISMSQVKYIEAFFELFQLQKDPNVTTPMQENLVLSALEETQRQIQYALSQDPWLHSVH